MGSSGTRNQDLLCSRGPVAVIQLKEVLGPESEAMDRAVES
jgi:hypothetical protein